MTDEKPKTNGHVPEHHVIIRYDEMGVHFENQDGEPMGEDMARALANRLGDRLKVAERLLEGKL